MEYIFSGFIEYIYSDDDNFSKLKLRGEDGYKINLVSRFAELKDSFKNKVSVSYFLSDHACTKDDAMTGFLNQMEGVIEAGNEVDSYYYSEYTNGTDYTTTLSIGGHSLLYELSEKTGKFCILTVEVLEEA